MWESYLGERDTELSSMKNYQYESQCQVNPVVLKLGTISLQCSQLRTLKWEVGNFIQPITFSDTCWIFLLSTSMEVFFLCGFSFQAITKKRQQSLKLSQLSAGAFCCPRLTGLEMDETAPMYSRTSAPFCTCQLWRWLTEWSNYKCLVPTAQSLEIHTQSTGQGGLAVLSLSFNSLRLSEEMQLRCYMDLPSDGKAARLEFMMLRTRLSGDI